jgi:hypothetical protein
MAILGDASLGDADLPASLAVPFVDPLPWLENLVSNYATREAKFLPI